MKTYVLISGVIFALLTLVHLWRIVLEPNLATEPWFIATTLAAAALAVAAWRVSRRTSPS
jgi:hypothetical protein